MKRRIKRQATLGDVIQSVAQFARTDHEVAVIVADLIGRGIVRVKPRKEKS